MRIKVTGEFDTNDLPFEFLQYVDPTHETGLSEQGYVAFATGEAALPPLDDLEFEAIPDE